MNRSIAHVGSRRQALINNYIRVISHRHAPIRCIYNIHTHIHKHNIWNKYLNIYKKKVESRLPQSGLQCSSMLKGYIIASVYEIEFILYFIYIFSEWEWQRLYERNEWGGWGQLFCLWDKSDTLFLSLSAGGHSTLTTTSPITTTTTIATSLKRCGAHERISPRVLPTSVAV